MKVRSVDDVCVVAQVPNSSAFEIGGQILGRPALFHGSNLSWPASGDNSSTFLSCARPHVNDPVAARDNLHLMLHDDNRIAGIN